MRPRIPGFKTFLKLTRQGEHWKIFLRFQGWNPKRHCQSDCWYTLEFKGSGLVEITWGKTGSAGNSLKPTRKSLGDAWKALQKKISNGYEYQDHLSGVWCPTRLSFDEYKRRSAQPKTPPLAHMPPPFCDIVRVDQDDELGLGWVGKDAKGRVVCELLEESAVALIEMLKRAREAA